MVLKIKDVGIEFLKFKEGWLLIIAFAMIVKKQV